ncbi:sugar-binding transcriptional regulator [Corynebacterium uterequi]|uniref:Transcriptional regulator with sigma factor-related N-terminal domain n=1 Tax=Corynebacterium uterequi TaxID=1072256 RepID=A0A0G3HHH3_9CORY|nr:sugar-binding transcriptional regulator [Corynebacterium uterequi]AKK11383.1 transcriptional regulator with sigma factor-related N-terminal domain [Corynebacterium uterequi]
MESRDEQALRAAKLYYISGMSQAEVAAEIGMSRPTVAKLLGLARERGYVTIEIHDPREQRGELTNRLLERYRDVGLSEARIVDVPRSGAEVLLGELGRAGAQLLTEHVHNGDLVGVSWGRTMYAVARALERSPRSGVEIVQLKGGMSYTQSTTNDVETITLFCQAFDAYARTLPLPVIFDNPEVKRIVESDRHIAQILELGRQTDVAIFTVGHIDQQSLPLTLGYLSDEEMTQLRQRAVGDVCSRFFTESGQVALRSVDERTVGISLADLATRPTRILVAGGQEKATAIDVALRMGLATHLVVDRDTAGELVRR